MVSHGCGGAIAQSGFDSAIISHGRVSSSPVGSMCMQERLARLPRKISRIAMSTAMTRACDRADCVIIDRRGQRPSRRRTPRVAEHSSQLSIDTIGLRRRRVERNRNCSSAALICSSTPIRWCRVQHDGGHAQPCSAASARGGPSQRYILSAKCIPGILRAVRLDRRRRCPPAGTFCASQSSVRGGKGDETSLDCRENNEKTKARRKGFALRYLRQMMGLPWNQPKAVRLAWQARRSPLLGRRTEAERLYSDHGHRGGARLATFARTRIRGFEEVLRARDGRA